MKGFNLLEIIIAMLMVALMAISLIFLFILSYQETVHHTQTMIATNLAIEQIELLKSKNYDEIKPGIEESIASHPEFQRSWTVEENVPAPYIKRLVVTVERKSQLKKLLQVQLVLYKSKG